MTLLTIKKLHTLYNTERGTIHAVRGIDLVIQPKERVGIVGESGCGKTALAKTILQLNPNCTSTPTGEIWYKDQDLLSYSEREMRKIRGNMISMIFQDPLSSLNPTVQILEQVIEGFMHHNPYATRPFAIERALRLLELVGLKDVDTLCTKYPHELSGGMRQRVMTAIAMMCNPDLLIADEPTTALDTTIQAQIIDLLKSLDTAILLISHDIGVVSALCDRIIVMYGGTIVEDAWAKELLTNPKHPYTQKLLESAPSLYKNTTLRPIPGSPPNLAVHAKGCPFADRCAYVKAVCKEIPPTSAILSDTHEVACHIYQPQIEEFYHESSPDHTLQPL